MPRAVRDWVWKHFRAPFNLWRHYLRDAMRFWKYNLRAGHADNAGVERSLRMCVHIIEKGLSLKNTRPYFGRDVIQRVLKETEELRKSSYSNPRLISSAVEAIKAYRDFHHDFTPNESQKKLLLMIDDFLATSASCSCQGGLGGTFRTTRTELERKLGGPLSEGLRARHSIRTFSDRQINQTVIDRALSVAQASPSACNLQPVRVHVATNREMIDELLRIQAGARGFYEQVMALFVIAYEVGLQIGPRSRNQGYIDAGIFAQSLMLALLNEQIGTCPLNWAQEASTDAKLRSLMNIPDSQTIVMLVAGGYLPEEVEIAKSSRIPLDVVRRYVE